MVDLAVQLIGQKSAKFAPERFKDHYSTALRLLVKDKMKGNAGRFGPTAMPNYAFPDVARVRTPAQGGTGREEDGRTHSEVGGPVEQAGETTAAAGPAPRKDG